MRLVFGKVFADEADPYVREKLRRGFRVNADAGGDNGLEEQVSNVLREQLGAPPPVLSPEPLSALSPGQEAEVEARKRCAQGTLLRQWPLVQGEEVEEDFFTFLQEPFGAIPAQTVALHRRTNLAETYYLFDDVTVAGGDLTFADPPEPPPPPHPLLRAGKPSYAATLAKSLGSSLASTIGSKIGALIFESIFPPEPPSYFDDVYAEVRNIVKQELSAHMVEQVSGRVNGTVAWVRKTYKPRKEAGAPREELSAMVSSYVDALYRDAVYTLMEPNHAKPGFAVFLLAAGVHMGLMQEQVLVDPRQSDPKKSSYATSVRLSAQEYHDHAIKTFDEIVRIRREAVTIRDVSRKVCVNHSCNTTYIYRWADSVTNGEGRTWETYTTTFSKEHHDGKKEAEGDAENHRNDVVAQLTKDLSYPKEIAASWLKLKERPIPV